MNTAVSIVIIYVNIFSLSGCIDGWSQIQENFQIMLFGNDEVFSQLVCVINIDHCKIYFVSEIFINTTWG